MRSMASGERFIEPIITPRSRLSWKRTSWCFAIFGGGFWRLRYDNLRFRGDTSGGDRAFPDVPFALRILAKVCNPLRGIEKGGVERFSGKNQKDVEFSPLLPHARSEYWPQSSRPLGDWESLRFLARSRADR
jgi:hypothetical protein